MAILEKKYTYEFGNENLYEIDTYNTDPTKKSLEITPSDNIRFKNLSDNRNTDNFYGDGRLSSVQKRDTAVVRPKCLYFWEVRNHEIYGWCIWKQWFNELGDFNVGDEVVLYKKHIELDDYMNELGDWEIVNIKEIIKDNNGTHYVIDRAPTYEWTSRTCNSATLVYQYKSLEIFDNSSFSQDLGTNHYTSTPEGLWSAGRVRISKPDGILFIKSQEFIKIGRNSNISSRYGYNGAHAYRDHFIFHQIICASGPRGGGSLESANTLTASLIDTRSPGCVRRDLSFSSGDYTNIQNVIFNSNVDYAFTGGFVDGRFGINHTTDTSLSREFGIQSSDLNRKLYCGIGTAVQSLRNLASSEAYFSSQNTHGRTGGGILVVQTPKIIFEDKSSVLATYESGTGSRQFLGYGGGGSLLVKAEELLFKENPNQWQSYKDITANEDVDYRAESSFRTGHIDPTKAHLISNPGLIQIEFDKWINEYENETYNINNITEKVKKDHIFDYKIEYVKQLRGLIGTLNDWDISNSLKYYNHAHVAPVFENGVWFKLLTRGYNNININEWEDLVKIFTSYTLPEGTEIKIAFSTTNGSSWFYLKDLKTNPTATTMLLTQNDFNTKGNTVDELDGFTSSFLLTNTFLFTQADKDLKTIDVCIAMKTTKSHISPLMNYIWFDYNKMNSITAPIPIKPYNGEEFENEYVNFVWLQPESRRGSVQNRLEINDVPSFSQDFKNIKAISSDSSSTAGKIHLPFQGSEYNDYISTCKNFKLPYLKRRFSPVTVQGEENLPSLKFENGKVKYPGGDIYFRKGTTVQLLGQPDLTPPDTKYTLKDIVIPREGNLISHFDFTNMPNFSKASIIKDLKPNGTFDFNTSLIGLGLTQLENNVLHGDTVSFTGKNTGAITLLSPTLHTTVLDSTKDTTFMMRFVSTDLVNNVWNGLLHICTSVGHHIALVEIYPYFDNGTKYYRIRNYTHAAEQYSDVQGFEEGSENVIVLTIGKNGANNLYLNGTMISSNTRYIGSGTIKVELGSRTQISFSDYGLNGQILEFGVWNIALTEAEIKEISKVSHWHLRYDFSDNKLRWYRVPYNTHLKHYKYIKDEVSYINMRTNTHFFGTIQDFAGGGNECYGNYHDTLLMGKYKPSRITLNPFSIHSGVLAPMQSIPVLRKRFATPVNNYKNVEYNDNNSFNFVTGAATEYQVAHGRHPLTNNYSMTFMYNNEQAVGYSNLGLVRGALSAGEASAPNVSMCFYMIYSNTPTYDIYIVNSAGAWTRLYNAPFPYDLKNNHIYEVQFISEEGFNKTKCIFKSNTDDNYKLGVNLGTISTAPTKGYNSASFRDMTYIAANANFEEFGCVIRTETVSAWQLIDINTFDVNSIKTQESGFLNKYEIYQNISKSTLKKINNVKFDNFSNNPGADIRTFVSFNNGVTYKVYNITTKVWTAVSPDIPTNGMEVKDVIGLSTYDYSATGGLVAPFDNIIFRFVLYTTNPFSSSLVSKIDISYNGPIIIDSWKEIGSFFNGTQFYQSESGWSPFVDPDFTDASQNWKLIGTDAPSPSKLTATNGAKPSYADKKVFGGARVLLNPKGKYYWRVASYNGI